MAKAATAQRIRAQPKSLASYQQEIVCAPWFESLATGTDRARIDTFVKSRRIGGSVAAAYRAALWATGLELGRDGNAITREPMDVILVSKDFPSAKRLLREVADALEDLSRVGPEFDHDPQATTIKLKNGQSVEAIACSDKAIRGNTAAVIADEFAFWRQQEACWAAIKSVTDPNFKFPAGLPALFVTTAWDSSSLAHRIFTDSAFPFHRHSVDIHQAVADGFPIDPERAFEELGIPELIASEYLCQWSRGGDSFFPLDKLRDCQEHELPDGWERAPAFFGVDVGGGRGRDLTADVQWRLIDGVVWMVGVKASNEWQIDERADIIVDWARGALSSEAKVTISIDRGVMGGDTIDMVRKGFTSRERQRVSLRGLGMMPADQERYASHLRRMLEHGKLRFYTGTDAGGDEQGARTLLLELSQLKSKPGVGGHLTFSTPRDASKGHLDRAWAALLGTPGTTAVQTSESEGNGTGTIVPALIEYNSPLSY